MALTIQALADGQLPAAAAALYTVPGATQAVIKTITLVNTDTVVRAVNLYINATGVNRRIIPEDMDLGPGNAFVFDDELMLEAADMIQGDADAANVIDYTINGIENA